MKVKTKNPNQPASHQGVWANMPYGVGNRIYSGGWNSPNRGPTSDPHGYNEREIRNKAKRNALLRRMKNHNQERAR